MSCSVARSSVATASPITIVSKSRGGGSEGAQFPILWLFPINHFWSRNPWNTNTSRHACRDDFPLDFHQDQLNLRPLNIQNARSAIVTRFALDDISDNRHDGEKRTVKMALIAVGSRPSS
jgi:hypothetical protein